MELIIHLILIVLLFLLLVCTVISIALTVKSNKKASSDSDLFKDGSKRDIYALFTQIRNLNKWISYYKQRTTSSTIKHFVYLIVNKKTNKVITCFENNEYSQQYLIQSNCIIEESEYKIQEIEVK